MENSINPAFLLVFAVLAGAVLALAMSPREPDAEGYQPPYEPGPDPLTGETMSYTPPSDNADQLTTPMEDLAVTFTPDTYLPSTSDAAVSTMNEKAFLDMIAYAEGTSGPDGYRTMFGHTLFESFADHPRKVFNFTNKRGEKLKTSAAGRYQFLARTWDGLQRRLSLPDFGPESQDTAALELVRERGALADVQAGRVTVAIAKCSKVWASLPGAGYAQPERKLTTLIAQFQGAGGNLEA